MELKICKACGQNFNIEVDDFEFLKKFEVPAPTHCPDCRNQRRLTFRNDRNFYKRSCDMCEKTIISIYSTDKPFPVYCKDCFLSDKFDPLKYGLDFNFDRPFFEQFEEMRAKVPRIAMYQTMSENSDYTVHSGKNRNCYMGNALRLCEDVYYSDFAQICKDSMDLYMCSNVENCYFCNDSDNCYNSSYLGNCLNLTFSYLCFDCRTSSNLIGCVGLRRKEFMIFNQKVTNEEYEKTLKRLNSNPDFRNEFVAKYKQLRLEIPVKYFWDKNSDNCSGNHIVNSKNASHCYNVWNVEDGRYLFDCIEMKDSMDNTRIASCEFLYETQAAIDLNFSKFCNLCYQCSNLEYCDNCQSSHNNFGCMSLKGNRFCILNKQYVEEEYKKMLDKIKENMLANKEYGEFFPFELSVFGYNETKANDFYPLTQEEALVKGLKWKNVDIRQYQAQTYKIPYTIQEVSDAIVEEILGCETCGKNYKIIPQELKFYRKMRLPVPIKCFECRHKERLALENPRKLWDRNCMKCGIDIKTTYVPERKEKVYCEKCYLAEIQ